MHQEATGVLRHSPLFHQVSNGEKIPNKTINLGDDIEETPLVTVGDSAFPRFEWLIKSFNENTNDPKEHFFNEKLCIRV